MSNVIPTWKVRETVEMIASLDRRIYEAQRVVDALRSNQRSLIKRLRRLVEQAIEE